MQVQDKRVVVTGAASGIGKALCEAFNNAGAKSVVCVDMNLEGVTATANDIFLPVDQPEIFKVSPGEKMAAIGSANVSVTEMSA